MDEKHDEAPVTVPSREETVYTPGTTRASTTPPDWRTSGRRAMARKKVSTTIYIEPEQLELLKLLNERTKVPMAEYIREGIDLVLKRHQDKLPGQLPLEPPATSKG